MQYEHITTDKQLESFCDRISAAHTIAFDTEFVSEDTYRPELCLVQVAAGGELAVIDPQAVNDLTPFWKLLTDTKRETIVHAGREELRFCLRAIGDRPSRLLDVQIAAGFIGLEYPASYGTLLSRVLKKSLAKGETRTNWRRRPLSDRQIEYALQDVLYLEPLRDKLVQRLEELGRHQWLKVETEQWQQHIESAEANEQWRRVSGTSGLKPRQLAIVRELWRWRDGEAERRDKPPRRVLRDDLIVEFSRRQSSDPKRIRAIRGMERRDLSRHVDDFAAAIERALQLPDDECPRPLRRSSTPELTLLGQFMTTALGSICRHQEIASSLVGTAQDVRDLIAWRLNMPGISNEPPALACGWRESVVGSAIDELLQGKLVMRITDPLSSQPLTIEPRGKK